MRRRMLCFNGPSNDPKLSSTHGRPSLIWFAHYHPTPTPMKFRFSLPLLVNRFAWTRPVVIVCLGCALLLNACSTTALRPNLPALDKDEAVSTLHVEYPILLLHGLGQKSHAWEGKAVGFYEQDMGMNFGGVLSMNNGRVQCVGGRGKQKDFYTVSFTNPTDSVAAWGRELDAYIQTVLQQTKASKVLLIGYSMGGLAARYYLTHHLSNHHVRRLITIGTPHLGSPFARVYSLKHGITESLSKNPNIVSTTALKAALATLSSCESDVAFDAPAVHDLMRPEDGGVFLDALGKAEHPMDVDYVSVVGEVDVAKEVGNLSSAAVQEILRRALEFFDSGMSAWFSSGDGVVNMQSQNITNIPFFKNNPQHQRLARTVSLSSVHTEHLQNSNEIQRVTLEDKPEFKSAEFRMVDGNPCLVIEYSDLLTCDKSTASVVFQGLAGEQRRSAPNHLVRLEDGSLVHRAVIRMDDADFAKNFSVSVEIANYFQDKCSTTKQWIAP